MDQLEFRIIVAGLLIGFMVHRGYYTRKMEQSSEAVREQPELGIASKIANLLPLPGFLETLTYVFYPAWMSWSALNLPLSPYPQEHVHP